MLACLLLAATPLLGPDQPGDDQAKEALAPLQGMWKLASFEAAGQAQDLPDDPPRWFIKGNKVLYGGSELAVLTVNNATTPRCLDLAFVSPKRVLEGIYTVEGNTLKVCVNRQAEGVKERPNGFATQDKPEWRLLVFEREKDAREGSTAGLAGFVGMVIKADPDRKEVLVDGTQEGSPAQKAGLKKGDVLVRVGGGEATDLQGVIKLVRQVKPGNDLTVRVRRDGKEQDFTVKVGVVPFMLLD
jgi:uncharacterized protein (TIGR03067 family)